MKNFNNKLILLVCILFLAGFTENCRAGWQALTSGTSNSLRSIYFRSNQINGYAVGNGNSLNVTTNAGQNWNDKSFGGNRNFTSVFEYSSQFSFIVGENNGNPFIAKSQDQGYSWTLINANLQSQPNNVYCYSLTNSFIVGNAGYIYNSLDTGKTWTQISNNNPNNLNSISFGSSLVGIIVGDNGAILNTTDGGNNWNTVNNGPNVNLNSVCFYDQNTAFVSGDTGTILKLTLVGNNWQISNLSYGLTNNLNSITFNNSKSQLFAVGDNGTIITSTNNGTSWSNQTSTVSSNLNSVSFSTDNIGYICGDNKVILKTLDAGCPNCTPTVQVLTPNGGETLITGSTYNITWTSSNVDNVVIDYSINNIDSNITTVMANSSSYQWTIPNLNSNGVKIKIGEIKNGIRTNIVDLSDQNFTIDNKLIDLTSPNGNGTYTVCSVLPITWTSANISNIDIYYSTDGGSTYPNLIASNILASLGQYNWLIPSNLTTNNQVKVKITQSGNANKKDESGNNFTIQAPSFNFISPINGDSWNGLSTQKIKWTSTNINQVNIDISTDNGSTYTPLVINFAASVGEYSYLVPNIIANQCKVRVTQVECPNKTSISGTFSFNPIPIIITSPNGGEKYQISTQQTITWSSVGVNNVNIQYSINNGNTWNNLASGVSSGASNSYNWQTGNIASDKALIKITDATIAIKTDVSNAPFTIGDIAITSPANNANYALNSTISINWTKSFVNSVMIEYSIDNMNTWTTINPNNVTNAQSFIGSFGSNTNVVFRVKDNNSSIFAVTSVSFVVPTLTLTNPLGGECWKAQSQKDIKWDQFFVDFIDICYSTNSGNNWINLASSVNASLGTYKATLPNIPSANLIFKVKQTSNQAINSQSGVLSLNTENVTVVNPNGGQVYYKGDTRQITWNKTSGIGNINIDYSTDNGTSWMNIASAIPSTPKSYNWLIPNKPTSKALVKITSSTCDDVNDQSDANFGIAGLDLTSPNGGEVLVFGSNYQIKWASYLVNSVDIYYSLDNGNTYNLLTSGYPASLGFYNWKVPNLPSITAKIKIIDPKNSTFVDSSDNVFSITGLKVTNPIVGSTYLIGDDINVTWQSTLLDSVKIEYSFDSGNNWITVTSLVDATTGSYLWSNIPETPSTKVLVRLTGKDTSFKDIMQGYFTIKGDGVVLKSHNNGETVNIGSNDTLKWASSNVQKINLYYSTNRGNTWISIVNNINANLKQYIWFNVPNTSTPEALIKIEDSDYPINYDISDTTFQIKGAWFLPPSSWAFTSQTFANTTIIIPSTITSQIGPRILRDTADYIGVFFTRGNQQICAGYSKYSSINNTPIAVWGDDPFTTIKDGMAANEKYIVKIWDGVNGVEYDTETLYVSNFDTFVADRISVANLIRTKKTLNINMPANSWEIISSNLVPDNSNLVAIMQPNLSKLLYMKDETGNIYYPDQNINTITNWNIQKGYQTNFKTAGTISITGADAILANYTYNFTAGTWYIIAYLPQVPLVPSVACSTLVGSNALTMIKDSRGRAYSPSLGINQLDTMKPTQGYKLLTQTTTSFRYVVPVTGGIVAPSSSNAGIINKAKGAQIEAGESTLPSHFKFDSELATGSNSTMIVKSIELTKGDEVGVFNSKNRLIGSAIFDGDRAVITVIGDNSATMDQIEGALNDEILSVRLWNKKTNKEFTTNLLSGTDLVRNQIIQNNIKYYQDAIWYLELSNGKETTEVEIGNNELSTNIVDLYPNPASSVLNLLFNGNLTGKVNLKIINSLGFEVLVKEISADNSFGTSINIQSIPNAVYYIIIESESQRLSGKFVKID